MRSLCGEGPPTWALPSPHAAHGPCTPSLRLPAQGSCSTHAPRSGQCHQVSSGHGGTDVQGHPAFCLCRSVLSPPCSWHAVLTGMGSHPCRDRSPGHSYCCKMGREEKSHVHCGTMNTVEWQQLGTAGQGPPSPSLGTCQKVPRELPELQHGPGRWLCPGRGLPLPPRKCVEEDGERAPGTASAGSALRKLHLEHPDVKFHGPWLCVHTVSSLSSKLRSDLSKDCLQCGQATCR